MMASLTSACRLSARLAMGRVRQEVSARGFRSCSANQAASNFTMPALSPTMTEGNISSWKVKEGDSFTAGDVLLEIETDKATMDVEAQDDGIMAKIIVGDGSKGIQVGSRIGVLAEVGDDIQSLEMPAEASSQASSPKKEASKPDSAKTSESQAEAKPSSGISANSSSKSTGGKAKKQTYPLLPSVEHLIHQHGLDSSAIDNMTPTGPNNRLLKGDVLAYLGTISASYPAELSGRIAKLSHLDLSNIKLAAQPSAPKVASSTKVAVAEPKPETSVTLPISMAAVLEVQQRIQSTLGVTMSLATFIARAADVANDDLPRSKIAQPTADELFNQVLGLEKVHATARGSFIPQITALPPKPLSRAPISKKADIFDILTGKSTVRRSQPTTQISEIPSSSTPANLFSVTVPHGDEKRAKLFLERVKLVLESEPGRLVL